ncbi:MAG: enoyl-CoA hydratase/isomerase family protein [Actinomycetota bacterium]|nr:enoyl-CoA hydratase/isomerase family protein [Actinomycetota bacterium]
MPAEPPRGSDAEVLYDSRDRVARITINRPHRRNALTGSAIDALHQRLGQAKADPDVGVVVLAGAGGQAFCSGLDLSELAADSMLRGHIERGQVAELFTQLWGLGKPTVAAVRGFALAGGFGLALACDLVICSDDATFGTPEIDVGLWPYMITVPLMRSMPPKKALELMLTGRRVGAAEAERIGFVNRVVPAVELDAAVADLAATLAAKSPAAMRLGRDSFYAVWDLAARDAFACLHPMLTVTAGTDDAVEGRTAFQEKRPPRWTGS